MDLLALRARSMPSEEMASDQRCWSKHELGICPSILTGMIEWMGTESPDTTSLGALGFLLVLALAKSAPTLAGSRPVVTDA